MGQNITEKQPSRFFCDPAGCVLKRNADLVAFPETMAGVEMDCRRADIIVSRIPVPEDCVQPRLVIDKFDLWRRGAHSLYISAEGKIEMETANDLRGDRPWIPERYRNRLTGG